MALEQKLSLKQTQKLVMTPSLQQAIKLLQMTRIELEGVLTQELVENPILEEVDQAADEEEDPLEENEDDELEEALEDIDLEAYFDEVESWEGTGQPSMHEHKEAPPIENTLTQEDDLYDHLLWQLHMMDVPDRIREIAELIIGNLDPDGFLGATLEEIQAMGADDYDPRTATVGGREHEARSSPDEAGETEADATDSEAVAEGEAPEEDEAAEDVHPAELDNFEPEKIEEEGGYARADVEEALELVRNLDPPGVACSDLRESLLRQLDAAREAVQEDADEEDLAELELTHKVVAEYWSLFKKRKFEKIAKDLGVPLQDLKPVVDFVGNLDTRPGRQYDTDQTQYVEPDVHVVKVGGKYEIQLNESGLPRLRVSRAYRAMLRAMRKKGRDAEAQQYIKEKMRAAMWLIKSLDQRQRTIYKVTKSIIEQQRGFLDHGVSHLKPMVLRDVAEDIEMHESTVSRVVSNKYMHTPRGVLPMKYFFHSGIDREYGGDISSLTVKQKIENMIEDEDPDKPLSDSEIMRVLKREGIQIARRTVAKYRDELGIPSSTDRKKIF